MRVQGSTSTLTGSMRHRITLSNPKRISNGRGSYTMDYAAGDKMEVWAAAELLSISLQMQYNRPEDMATIRFIIRENPFVKRESTRIEHDGAVLLVTQVAPVRENPRFWEVRAREV